MVCQTLQSGGLGLQEEGLWPQAGGAMGIVVVAVAGRGRDGREGTAWTADWLASVLFPGDF